MKFKLGWANDWVEQPTHAVGPAGGLIDAGQTTLELAESILLQTECKVIKGYITLLWG